MEATVSYLLMPQKLYQCKVKDSQIGWSVGLFLCHTNLRRNYLQHC